MGLLYLLLIQAVGETSSLKTEAKGSIKASVGTSQDISSSRTAAAEECSSGLNSLDFKYDQLILSPAGKKNVPFMQN